MFRLYKRLAIRTVLVAAFVLSINSLVFPDGMVISGSVVCSTATDSVQFALASVSANTTTVTATNQRGVVALAGNSFTNTGISVYCVDASSDTGSIVAELYAYDTTGDQPTGAVLATVTVANSALPNSAAQYIFEFSATYTLNVAVDYCIIFYGTGGGQMTIYRDNTNSIANSFVIHSDDSGSTWAEDATYDLRGDGWYGCA